MMRSACIYVTPQTARDCKTAAMLLGVASPDEWAEMVLREALGGIPALVEYREKIASAIASAKKEWEAAHKFDPAPDKLCQ